MDHATTDTPPGSPSAYAGVGSRRTPAPVLAAMRDLAESLGDLGWALSTGGANGADTAFQDGALRTDAAITVHAPWHGYNGFRPGRERASDIDVIVPRPDERLGDVPYADLARRHHPFWGAAAGARGRCSCATSPSSPAPAAATPSSRPPSSSPGPPTASAPAATPAARATRCVSPTPSASRR